ncbi:MAG: hypothetical protein ACJ0OP_02080 [Thermodesulfobacteriota bacterium]
MTFHIDDKPSDLKNVLIKKRMKISRFSNDKTKKIIKAKKIRRNTRNLLLF